MSWRSNDALNSLSPIWLEIGFTRTFGGWLDIKLFTQAQAGNKLYYWRVGLWYYWVLPNGSIVASSSAKETEINSPNLPLLHEGVWSNVMNLPNPVDAYLRVAVDIFVIDQPTPADPPCYYESLAMIDVPSIMYSKPPDKIVANPPDNPPIQNTWANCYSGLDFNGSNTQYMAEYSKADGSNLVTIPYQNSNLFSILAVGYPQTRWRAKAKNDLGEGQWSDWCYFGVVSRIEGYVSAQVQPISNKPSHWLRASISVTSGHTINSIRWTIRKAVNGQNNQIVDTGWVQYTSIEYLLNNEPSNIDYYISVEVKGTKPGDPGESYSVLYCSATYFPEGLEP